MYNDVCLAGGTDVPPGTLGYKRGWPGQIQLRKMVDKFKAYLASQHSAPTQMEPQVHVHQHQEYILY